MSPLSAVKPKSDDLVIAPGGANDDVSFASVEPGVPCVLYVHVSFSLTLTHSTLILPPFLSPRPDTHTVLQ